MAPVQTGDSLFSCQEVHTAVDRVKRGAHHRVIIVLTYHRGAREGLLSRTRSRERCTRRPTFSLPSFTIATSSSANDVFASEYWLTASSVASATSLSRPVWLAGPLAVPVYSAPPISSKTLAEAWTPLTVALIEQIRGRIAEGRLERRRTRA